MEMELQDVGVPLTGGSTQEDYGVELLVPAQIVLQGKKATKVQLPRLCVKVVRTESICLDPHARIVRKERLGLGAVALPVPGASIRTEKGKQRVAIVPPASIQPQTARAVPNVALGNTPLPAHRLAPIVHRVEHLCHAFMFDILFLFSTPPWSSSFAFGLSGKVDTKDRKVCEACAKGKYKSGDGGSASDCQVCPTGTWCMCSPLCSVCFTGAHSLVACVYAG